MEPTFTDPDAATEWLFARSWEDLNGHMQRWRALTMYEKLHVGALLRKLLLDGGSLALRVNRSHRLPLTFRAHEYNRGRAALSMGLTPPGASGSPILQGGTVIPGQDATPILELTLSQWLKHPFGYFEKQQITVHDIIDYVAHVEGGVHMGRPKTFADEAFHKFNEIYYRDDVHGDAGFHEAGPAGAMIGIGIVSRDGLRPLYEATKARSR